MGCSFEDLVEMNFFVKTGFQSGRRFELQNILKFEKKKEFKMTSAFRYLVHICMKLERSARERKISHFGVHVEEKLVILMHSNACMYIIRVK